MVGTDNLTLFLIREESTQSLTISYNVSYGFIVSFTLKGVSLSSVSSLGICVCAACLICGLKAGKFNMATLEITFYPLKGFLFC